MTDDDTREIARRFAPQSQPEPKPSGRIGRDGWQVVATVIIGTIVVAALIFFGG